LNLWRIARGRTCRAPCIAEAAAQSLGYSLEHAISCRQGLPGRGHHHETYRIEDGAWRIATLMPTRLRLDISWPEGHAA